MDSYQHGKDRMIEMSAEEKKESRDHILARKARYREKNRKLIRERDAQYREDNKLELSTRASRHYQKNRDREIERCTQHASTVHAKRRRAEMYRYRYMVDPEFRCAQNMRWIVKRMAKSDETKERKRTREALGYSAKELKEHLEKQFQPGMSWDNHGEWHIDHIIPISAHIQSGETNPKVVNCLTNLRPMWAKENISKGGSRTHLL
tara:strand:+ start:7282 stop:7899 length:618 start_codon:yes stop_codon:yes gene_type:complete